MAYEKLLRYRLLTCSSLLNPRQFLDEADFYAYWAGSVVGPFLHILAVVHALLWGFPGSIVGSIVSTPV